MSKANTESQIENQLEIQIPPVVNRALVNAVDDKSLLGMAERRILKAINPIQTDNRFPLIQSITLKQLKIFKHSNENVLQQQNPAPQIQWHYGDYPMAVRYQLNYRIHWINLLSVSLALSFALFSIYQLLPNRTRQLRKSWQKKLQPMGFSEVETNKLSTLLLRNSDGFNLLTDLGQSLPNRFDEALNILSNSEIAGLTHQQRKWFVTALNQSSDRHLALQVARSEERLIFDLAKQQVIIHGLPITLSKTPLFYYYWYATRKLENLSPYTNPGQTKPDREQGAMLADIMENHQGHKKAVNDLRISGLKGKTLDQNRNKLKDELQSALGTLASPYLFHSERDTRTARYSYSLQLSANKIQLRPSSRNP